ncbi:MAG: ATP-binding protein, partial [Pseudomonadota bacterium]
LERLAPPPPDAPNWAAEAFVFHADPARLSAVAQVNRVDLDLLLGVDLQKQTLLENVARFAAGAPANNALLWGARGGGKSALVKATHARIAAEDATLKLLEIHREDIAALPSLLNLLRPRPERFLLFCDDLSFEKGDVAYKSLKAVLDGGVEGRPDNVLFVATSNRRHLMPRDMIENEKSTAIHPGEAVEESVSLSDRFGLWLGFHAMTQDAYLAIVAGYADHFGLTTERDALLADAKTWSATRGSRSGRVAWQFIQDAVGREAAND